MDTGSGHIYEENRIKIEDIKGKLVLWEVDEEIIVKNCKFKVKEIRTFPADEIVLVGMPHQIFSDEFKEADRESSHKIMDFVKNNKNQKEK